MKETGSTATLGSIFMQNRKQSRLISRWIGRGQNDHEPSRTRAMGEVKKTADAWLTAAGNQTLYK